MMFRYGFAILNISALLHYELTNGEGVFITDKFVDNWRICFINQLMANVYHNLCHQ